MKIWFFRYTDDKYGTMGWSSVKARGKVSAIKKANRWCVFLDYTLLPHSVNSTQYEIV